MQNRHRLFLFLSCLLQLHVQCIISFPKDDSLKALKNKAGYQVWQVEGVNTKNSEFCAFPYQKGFVFVSDQLKDLVNHESVDVNGSPYVDVFYTELVNDRSEKSEPFSKKINGLFHDGPVAFSYDKTQLFLTRVEYINKLKRNHVNRAKIVVFDKVGDDWAEGNIFPYSNDSYSTGHASISKDGQQLFFVSDMPGGKGGKDIYVCRRNSTGWDKPENLGSHINTEGDEEFPFIRNDGTLFFSSNGLKGAGGFDIFSARVANGKWYLKRNEGVDINSKEDDFGITFSDSLHGYFTSNRVGGKGLDDIYRFTYTESGVNILAALLLTENINDPAIDALIYLLNDKGKILDSTRTDAKGAFKFENLLSDKSYMVAVDEDDISFKGKAKFFLANSKGEIVRESHSFKKNDFVFEDLPLDNSRLQEIYSDDDLTLSGALSHGSNPSVFIKHAELYLVNSFGDVVDTAITNELGYFVFKNLVSGQDYMVTINDKKLNLPEGTTVNLTDKDGKKLKAFVVGKDAFNFKLLSHEKTVLSDLATDEELSFTFNNCTYGQDKLILKSLAGKKVYLLDGKGRIIDSLITNRKGKFKFNNLNPDIEYIVAVEENDISLKGKTEFYLVNSNGNIVKVSYPYKNKKFVFRNIPLDSVSLQQMTVDDKLFLAGNLRFGPHGENPVMNTRIYLLNESGVVIDSVISNEYGCFSFRGVAKGHNYSMNISESDMKLPKDTKVILTEKDGKVVKVFHVGRDRFEYKILATEKNILFDMETNDADLVMKLSGYVFNSNRKAVKDARMILLNPEGHIIQTIVTDSTGRFSFDNSKLKDIGHIEIVSLNSTDSVLFIADHKGKIRKVLRKNSAGVFEYKLLEIDKNQMGEFTVDDPWLKVIEMKSSNEILTIVESIFYKTNDYKFDVMGQQILDKTINVLKSNPKLIMELSSHTDSRSNDKYNLKLSDKRAQYAVDYIVSKGIDKSRLKAIGYGETKLINQCANNISCSDEEHAKNRRTEFRITLNN